MLQLLINLLTPIFEGMGVSPTDVATYDHNLSGYIYAILGTLVLAWNNGVLPLSGTDKINVFGWAATNPIYGGTGSGSSSNEGNIDILTSLKNAGFEVNQELIDMYTEYSPTRTLAGVGVGFTDWSLPEPPADRYTDELMNNAKAFSDTAVIVLARSGGEGQDLPAEMAPGTGRTAMNALGKILKGTVNPSGRTVETYIYDQKATPAYNNYGSFTYDNVDALLEQYTAFDPGFQGALSFVNYVEGIYVGYRFYETAYAEAQAGSMTFDYDSVVQYPFGHGLSYTTFNQQIQNFSDNGNSVSFDVTVTNTGSVAGKEVVEVYFTPPYNNGGIEKAAVNLVNFAKTDLIYGWYGPAMNTHRTAFNGRSFEYYSEDGVLAGCIASAEINAAGEKGVYAYIKHFVADDQEINRCTAQQIYLTEQTLREIYMKPFEICVKNYDYDNNPLAVMTSFTLIGPKWTGANSELLNGVLRGERGFQGMVLTDWFGSYGYQVTMDSVLNGNDMMLGFGSNVRTEVENLDSPTMVKAHCGNSLPPLPQEESAGIILDSLFNAVAGSVQGPAIAK